MNPDSESNNPPSTSVLPQPLSLGDHLDHLTRRVTVSALAGLFLGGSHAIYRGYPAPRASLQVSVSCALAGTACFGIERMAHILLDKLINSSAGDMDRNDIQKKSLYVSHAVGGVLGGGLLGGIFQRRFISGTLLFTPLMIGAAYSDIQFQNWKQEKIRKMIQEQEQA